MLNRFGNPEEEIVSIVFLLFLRKKFDAKNKTKSSLSKFLWEEFVIIYRPFLLRIKDNIKYKRIKILVVDLLFLFVLKITIAKELL
jgi:hypothetical protein